MNPATLAQHHRRLRQDPEGALWTTLATVETAGLETLTTAFDDPAAAWAALAEAAPRQGWLQFQSHQTLFTEGLPEPRSDWGHPLAAEAVLDAHTGLRLHFQEGRWRLTRHTHRPDGADYLCDTVRHLIHAHPGRLVHRRYWRLDPEQGPVQHLAVLVGIEHPEEN